MYKCNKCGHQDPVEREVYCWECGVGEMIWQQEAQPTVENTHEICRGNNPERLVKMLATHAKHSELRSFGFIENKMVVLCQPCQHSMEIPLSFLIRNPGLFDKVVALINWDPQ